MGTWYRFTCPACTYAADISGGDDAGMAVVTTTIVCRACKKLYDAATRRLPISEEGADWIDERLRCPNSEGHIVELWKHPGAAEQPGCSAMQSAIRRLCHAGEPRESGQNESRSNGDNRSSAADARRGVARGHWKADPPRIKPKRLRRG